MKKVFQLLAFVILMSLFWGTIFEFLSWAGILAPMH